MLLNDFITLYKFNTCSLHADVLISIIVASEATYWSMMIKVVCFMCCRNAIENVQAKVTEIIKCKFFHPNATVCLEHRIELF